MRYPLDDAAVRAVGDRGRRVNAPSAAMKHDVLAVTALLLVALWVAIYNSTASWVALAIAAGICYKVTKTSDSQ